MRAYAAGPFDIVACIGDYRGGLDYQNVSIPLKGDLLQQTKGSVCAIVPRLPRFLNPGATYLVQLRGFRQPDGSPNATYALVSIRDGRDFTRIDFPQNGSRFLSCSTSDGYDFDCALTVLRSTLIAMDLMRVSMTGVHALPPRTLCHPSYMLMHTCIHMHGHPHAQSTKPQTQVHAQMQPHE